MIMDSSPSEHKELVEAATDAAGVGARLADGVMARLVQPSTLEFDTIVALVVELEK